MTKRARFVDIIINEWQSLDPYQKLDLKYKNRLSEKVLFVNPMISARNGARCKVTVACFLPSLSICT